MSLLLVVYLIIGIFLNISLCIVIYNNFTAPKISNNSHNLLKTPMLSILISVHNNENFIRDCLSFILGQGYNNYEVLVLDDNSKDNSADIVRQFSERTKRIKLIEGKKKPAGWQNINWVRHQLAKLANGDVFLFMDANIRLAENSINASLFSMQWKKADMISVFPTQLMRDPWEYFAVPLINWLLLSFIPIRKIYTSTSKYVIAVSSQFVMIDKNVYWKLGGYESVKNETAGDLEFAKLIKYNGNKLLTALGNDAIYSRMYHDFESAYSGFADNFYACFKTTRLKYIICLTLISILFFMPIPLSLFDFKFIWLALLIVLNRLLISFISNQSPLVGIIHPFQMLLFYWMGIKSMQKTAQ